MRARSLALVIIMVVTWGCGDDGGEPATRESEPGTADAEPEVDRITFAGSQPNAGNWVIQVGEAEGIFADYGVDVEMIFSGSSTAALAALQGGSVQFTSPTYDAGVLAHVQNDDLFYVAAGYGVAPYNLVVNPEIGSVEDIAGRTCSAGNAPNVGDGIFLQLMIELASGGEITYPDDYGIVNVPSNAGAVLGAMESGQSSCHALILPTSTLLAEEGYPGLLYAPEVEGLEELHFFGIATLHSWVDDNPIATDRFLQGYLASMAWLYDPANKDRAIEILAENAGIDLAIAEASYEWVESGGYPSDGLVLPENIRRTVEVSRRFGAIENVEGDVSETVVDMSYVTDAYEALPEDVRAALEAVD